MTPPPANRPVPSGFIIRDHTRAEIRCATQPARPTGWVLDEDCARREDAHAKKRQSTLREREKTEHHDYRAFGLRGARGTFGKLTGPERQAQMKESARRARQATGTEIDRTRVLTAKFGPSTAAAAPKPQFPRHPWPVAVAKNVPRAVVAQQQLRSGDIETNPGPGSRKGRMAADAASPIPMVVLPRGPAPLVPLPTLPQMGPPPRRPAHPRRRGPRGPPQLTAGAPTPAGASAPDEKAKAKIPSTPITGANPGVDEWGGKPSQDDAFTAFERAKVVELARHPEFLGLHHGTVERYMKARAIMMELRDAGCSLGHLDVDIVACKPHELVTALRGGLIEPQNLEKAVVLPSAPPSDEAPSESGSSPTTSVGTVLSSVPDLTIPASVSPPQDPSTTASIGAVGGESGKPPAKPARPPIVQDFLQSPSFVGGNGDESDLAGADDVAIQVLDPVIASPQYQPHSPPSRSPPPPPGAPAPPAKVEHVLNGHHLSQKDHELIMTKLVQRVELWPTRLIRSVTGKPARITNVSTVERDIPYVGDRRLATYLNVQEITRTFHAVEISALGDEKTDWMAIAIALSSVLLVALVGLGFFLNPRFLMPVPIPVLAIALMVYFYAAPVRKRYFVSYVPHLVSCVMVEYDRGTNAVAARSTMRQKLRRIAAFPLPDFDAVKFYSGTELVVEHLLERENFFWEGAACMGLPQ